MGQGKKLADILTEEVIDNSLRSQDDSGSSDQDGSIEFGAEEKLDTAKSNEIIEFIQKIQEIIRDLVRETLRDLVRWKDPTFNRYSDRLKH